MNAAETVAAAEVRGIELSVRGDAIHIKSRSRPPEHLRTAIRDNKPAIITLLKAGTQCSVLRQLLNSPQARQVAHAARITAGSEDVLYHGTRYTHAVLETMELRYSPSGNPAISLTRSPDVAAYWALLERRFDEGRGGVLVLGRDSLRRNYKIEPYHDTFWDHDPAHIDEMEEIIFGRDIVNLSRHLIGVIREPMGRHRKSRAGIHTFGYDRC